MNKFTYTLYNANHDHTITIVSNSEESARGFLMGHLLSNFSLITGEYPEDEKFPFYYEEKEPLKEGIIYDDLRD